MSWDDIVQRRSAVAVKAVVMSSGEATITTPSSKSIPADRGVQVTSESHVQKNSLGQCIASQNFDVAALAREGDEVGDDL
jgi:hypothetical protein